MKNKKVMIVALILLLAVGFATITTTLVINQTSNIGKAEDFSVIFTSAVLDGRQSDFLIKNDGKKIEFSTKELMKVGDTSVLNYEVTNNSSNYDARITIDCDTPTSEYYEVTKNMPVLIKAKEKDSGDIKVELKKVSVSETREVEFTCTLNVNAVERSDIGVETNIISGILKDNNGNILPNQTVVLFSTPKVTKTDDYGYFYISGIEAGEHNIYVMENVDDNYAGKTETEIEMLTDKIKDYGQINTSQTSTTLNGGYTISSVPMGEIPDLLLAPGLYASDGTMTYTWEELKTEMLDVSDGSVIIKSGKETDLVGKLVLDREVTSLADYAFLNCTGLTGVVLPNTVTAINSGAFMRCSNLKGLTIPSSVTDIGGAVFRECTSLENITIPDSVTTMGNFLFQGSTSLKDVTLPSNLSSINARMFYGCTSLENITIPDSVTSIGMSAFSGCTSLKNITIPSHVTSLGLEAFAGCSKLTSIEIPESVEEFKDNIFENCTNLKNVTIHNNMTSIPEAMFKGCTSLKNITIPTSVTTIEKSAFRGSGLTSITIPTSVTTIEEYAFSGSGLTSITIPNTVTNIHDNTFSNCAHLTNVDLPTNMSTIPEYAFSGCTSLKNITIPDSVSTIGRYAFNGSGLTSIRISNYVTKIGKYAFYECESLTDVIFDNPNNWSMSIIEIESSNLQNSQTAAQYLKTSHYFQDWTRS